MNETVEVDDRGNVAVEAEMTLEEKNAQLARGYIVPGIDIEGVVCSDVTEEDFGEIDDWIERMKFVCDSLNGAGLALTQIGVAKNVIIKKNEKGEYDTIINPIIYRNGGKVKTIEGCLSYPDEFYHLVRFKSVGYVYYDWNGKDLVKRTGKVKRFDSFVFQHETDHLKGITIAMKGALVDADKVPKSTGENGEEIIRVPQL